MSVLDFHWVLNDLALGGRIPPEGYSILSEKYSIRRIVDLRAEEQDDLKICQSHGVQLLLLPTPDQHPATLTQLWQGTEWICEGLAKKEKVLVHCEYGIGRSSLLTGCVLVNLGHSPESAFSLLKNARPVVSPSQLQITAFLEWANEWHKRNGKKPHGLEWEDVARIVYR